MKNYVASFLIFLLMFISVPPASAQTGDWNAVAPQVNEEVAVKVKNRKIVFGILTEADAASIKVKTPGGGKSVSEVVFKREEVEKIWLAKLSDGSRKTLLGVGIGAAVGAGAGAGLGLIALAADSGSDYAAIVIFSTAAIGAGFGAIAGGATGFFTRSKNKRERLVYQQ